MKIVYLLRNPGVAARTPEGWTSCLLAPSATGTYSTDELAALDDATVIVAGLDPVPEAFFERASGLKLVQRLGVGYCNIDLDAARRHGVPVCNMPDFNAATVAEHTLMFMLALARRVFDATLWMRAGRWPTNELVSAGVFDLDGKTLGIVGMGAIGRAVATRAQAFGMRICYYDQRPLPKDAGVPGDGAAVSLPVLLQQSDVVSVHLPLTPATRRLIGEPELSLMKPSALLINTARGAVVDELALTEAIRTRRIAGAGLDVFEDEPLPARHPLRAAPNVLLTPHLAGQTREAMERMVVTLLDNLARIARNEEPLYRVD